MTDIRGGNESGINRNVSPNQPIRTEKIEIHQTPAGTINDIPPEATATVSTHPPAMGKGITTAPIQNINDTTTIKGLLNEMYSSLTESMVVNKKIPSELIKDCKAILFLTLLKGGSGTGILMTHNIYKKNWNAPCGISIKYKSSAINFPSEKIHYLILIPNNLESNRKITRFPINDYLLLGVDIPITFQNNNQIQDINSNQSLLYALDTLDINATEALTGAIITIDKASNQQFYQKIISETDILNGNIKLTSNTEHSKLYHLLNNWSGIKTANEIQQLPYECNANVPLYRYYIFNEKDYIPSHEQISQFPTLPFLNDIKKKKPGLKFSEVGKKIYQSFKHLLHPTKNQGQKNVHDTQTEHENVLTRKWIFDVNIPLYQYYCNNIIMYDHKQLSSLPKYPFHDDIVSKRYSLQKYNPIHAIKSYIQTNRRANAIYNYYYNRDENKSSTMKKHWIFDENIPLFQYYVVDNENQQLLANTIQYNKAFLSKLPIFPFIKDIKIRKYSLFKYNPITFSKRIYRQITTKLQHPNASKSPQQHPQHYHATISNENVLNDNTNMNTANTDIINTNTNTNMNMNTTNMNTPNLNTTNMNTTNLNTSNLNTANMNTNINTNMNTHSNMNAANADIFNTNTNMNTANPNLTNINTAGISNANNNNTPVHINNSSINATDKNLNKNDYKSNYNDTQNI